MPELESVLKERAAMIDLEEVSGNAFQMPIPTCFMPSVSIPTHVRINTHTHTKSSTRVFGVASLVFTQKLGKSLKVQQQDKGKISVMYPFN